MGREEMGKSRDGKNGREDQNKIRLVGKTMVDIGKEDHYRENGREDQGEERRVGNKAMIGKTIALRMVGKTRQRKIYREG